MTKTHKSTVYKESGTEQIIRTLELDARYVSGPMDQNQFIPAGHVSTMGGKGETCSRTVKITNGSVLVHSNMRGLGVGTYLFNEVVVWAKEFDGAFRVERIKVASTDANDETNMVRRNKLYAHFNVRFNDLPDNEGVTGGHSLPSHVEDLTPYDGWQKKMDCIDLIDAFRMMGNENRQLTSGNSNLRRTIQSLTGAVSARDSSKKKTRIVCGVVIVIQALLLWWRW